MIKHPTYMENSLESLCKTEYAFQDGRSPFICRRLTSLELRHLWELSLFHKHSEMEIIYTEVPMVMGIEGRTHSLISGDILFVNPSEMHFIERISKSGGEVYQFVFDCGILKDSFCSKKNSQTVDDLKIGRTKIVHNPSQESSVHKQVQPIIKRLTKHADCGNTCGSEDCAVCAELAGVMEILFSVEFLKENDKTNRYSMQYVTECIRFVNENYMSDFTVYDIAQAANVSETYVYRLFRKYMGTTPVNYINAVRLLKAFDLLENGISITDTALEVGFSSISYFIKLFRDATGMTPKLWLKCRTQK